MVRGDRRAHCRKILEAEKDRQLARVKSCLWAISVHYVPISRTSFASVPGGFGIDAVLASSLLASSHLQLSFAQS